ncbi:translation initiation factor IF-3 [Candidatus Gottesmanbacteria bacterium]|nr:translation initiation factor IF-3 [Candidatus Gottesmanbacteria bacterium]
MNAKYNRKFYRLNYQIAAAQLRLLDEDGKQIGVVTKLEALQKAKEQGLDVVEIAPHATPPVAKLIDYKKFKYQEAKKDRESRKSQKNVSVKEIRLRPFIGAHDFDTRLLQAKDFLSDGNQVKLTLTFKGREITRKEFGFAVIKRFIEALESVKVVREPKMLGRVLEAMVVNDKKVI